MIDEPEIAPDDTNPHKPVSLEERLRREEPPLNSDDTSPSIVSRAALSGPARPASNRGQRLLGALMLVASLALTLGATILWMTGSDEGGPAPRDPNEGAPPLTSPPATSTAQAVAQESDDVATPTDPPPTAAPRVFPTAAADEIAAALLTPVPQQPVAYAAIPRGNAPFTIRPQAARTEVIQYTVQQGDTLESVASKFGLSDFNTIIWSNARNSVNPLRPGVQINVMPVDGVLFEVTENTTIEAVAERYGVDPYTIIDSEYNNTPSFSLFGSTPETLLTPGMQIVIPGAKGERLNVLAANTSNVSAGSAGGISGTYTLWGCTANVSGGTLPVNNPLGGGYTWMQGFVPGGHEGVDLSPTMGIGTPVNAAGAGTVVYAGWSNYGYGNVVVIAHGPAFTIYGHLDSYSVRCGQTVSAGTTIGGVGNTGNSSGPHLHFEVRDANFNPRNPQDYVSF